MQLTAEILNAILFSSIALTVAIVLGWITQRYLVRRVVRHAPILRSLNGASYFFWFLMALGLILQQGFLQAPLQRIFTKVWEVVGILMATIYLGRLLGRYIDMRSEDLGNSVGAVSLLQNIARLVVFLVGLLILLQNLGVPIAPALTALGVGGLAVALALQDTLSNLFAGIQIIASRKIRPGDFIRLDNGEEGFVTDITWRYVTIRTRFNLMLVVPNAKLSTSIFTNAWLPETEILITVPVGVHYDSDLERVERVTLEVATQMQQEHEGAVRDFEPRVRYNAFADFSINFNVIMRAREYNDQFKLRHDFIKALHKRYAREGIVIPYPIRTIEMAKKD
ncbi:MAG: mechanosensitive ion channel family protein [Saprospiraceae bacterium]